MVKKTHDCGFVLLMNEGAQRRAGKRGNSLESLTPLPKPYPNVMVGFKSDQDGGADDG